MDFMHILMWCHLALLIKAIAGSLFKSSIAESRLTVVAGKNTRILLSCPLSVRIPVTWIKDGKEIRRARKYIFSGGNLIISRITLVDEGRYECRSNIFDGSVYRATFKVVVNKLPSIVESQKGYSYQYDIGSTAIISCEANGKPKPDIFWINESGYSPINPPKITRINASSLKIKDFCEKDSRLLICIAQNQHGRARAVFRISTSKFKYPIFPKV